jgi:phosphinothricin acetyltransferase
MGRTRSTYPAAVDDLPDVRPATPDDAAAVQAIYARVVTGSVASFEETPPSVDEIARRMLAAPRRPWFAAVREGVVVGYAYAAAHRARPAYRWSVETSVYLAEPERGRGTGRALYVRLLDELRGLGYVTAFAGVALPNDASVGLHEAVGFRPVGAFRQVGHKNGAWHDVGWWQLALTPAPAEPPEPRPWTP